jgi:hypothetical protein
LLRLVRLEVVHVAVEVEQNTMYNYNTFTRSEGAGRMETLAYLTLQSLYTRDPGPKPGGWMATFMGADFKRDIWALTGWTGG